MENDFIEMMEPTPKLLSKKCKLISFLIRIFLQFSIYIIALIVWLIYDYFIAIATLLLSFIIMGILRSKIRNSVIPSKQREFQYSDQGIADWYTAKEICNDELEQKLEKI
ncbi:hypothetical protein [Sulfurimonas sp.]|uniref:hypothetical protein n=1 Tax=Sulfurimonas sp. TaxID=2022749 RepID=UPI0025E33AF5|nr:hypothetical protein [Sulfurimonas sp.]